MSSFLTDHDVFPVFGSVPAVLAPANALHVDHEVETPGEQEHDVKEDVSRVAHRHNAGKHHGGETESL